MGDSAGDGWNGNVFGVMQDNVIVGTFGETFTGGAAGNSPVYILVNANKYTQIIVKQLGTGKNDISFIVKAQNGTTIYQKTAGTPFYATTIFSTFCLSAACPAPATLNLTIIMTDSYGDGWNGNILTIKQNNAVVGSFGSSFTTGSVSSPVYIVVQGNLYAQIVVSILTSYTQEIGFTISAPNGTIIYKRNPGYTFLTTTIFTTFCPLGGCPQRPNVTYYLSIADNYGDGW